ncbi:MAG: hypothetical protein K2M48_01945 [Clostridiales bacterium]|nr:hypothetical protein [Clostridiales bacterium]
MANDTVETGEGEVLSNADVLSPEKNTENVEERSAEKTNKGSSFVGELVGISLKAIAVALSLFILIVSILTVAMPLSAMRVFNKLGMYERALNSGERYIASRLDDGDADITNDLGEYPRVMTAPTLADADMIEALDVCIKLSDNLMRDYVDSDQKSAAYFADELDKYIRIYMSLYGENAISTAKSREIRDSMTPALRPFVYDYKHTLMTMDYAARVYSGDAAKLDMMMYNSNGSGEFMLSMSDQSHNLSAVVIDPDTAWNLQMRYIDWFVDYVDQLSAYLGIQEERLGLTSTTNEVEANEKYRGVLSGNEFSIFVTPENGFTRIYVELKDIFTKYAQLAYDFNTRGEIDVQLHRLYWLRVLTTASDRLWNMGVLLNCNNQAYGQHWRDVYDEYGDFVFHYLRTVVDGYEDDGAPIYRNLVGAYNDAMADYLRNFNTAA